MSGSTIVAVKKELFARLSQLPALRGVQVSYAWKRDFGREVIYGGKARFDKTLGAMRGSAPRLPRDEQVTLSVVIVVRNLHSDPIAADERVVELLTVLEELLAADPTLAGFPNLLFAGISAAELAEPEFDDDGVSCGAGVEISYRSYLT